MVDFDSRIYDNLDNQADCMELYERFTDNDYKTPKGVRAALSMSQIDPFWVHIEKYRRSNAKGLNLRTVSGAATYRIVETPALGQKYATLYEKVDAFAREFETLDPELKEKFLKVSRVEALNQLVALERSKASDLTIKAMVNGMYRGEEPAYNFLKGYLDALEDMAFRGIRGIDEDFFVKEFEFLCQTAELTSFYRLGASNERSIRIQVGTAPEAYSDDIPGLMAGLSDFISTEVLHPVMKSLISLFALFAIKPFAEHNAEMAYLLAKAVLLQEGYNKAILALPIEKVLQPTDALEDNLANAMRSGDITYLVHYSLSILGGSIDAALDKMVQMKQEALKAEFVKEAKVEPPAEPTPVEVRSEPTKIVEAPAPQPKLTEPLFQPEAPAPAKEEVVRIQEIPAMEGERALNAPKASLSDKEVKETAKYLRESHPALSKGQCLFYASHCTMGRYYAIADYKKTIKCAYETARTSMDKLAAEGFYKKMQIKNKFVYTPIKQGENK